MLWLLDGETLHGMRGRGPASEQGVQPVLPAIPYQWGWDRSECVDCLFCSNYMIATLKGDLLHVVPKDGMNPVWYPLSPA